MPISETGIVTAGMIVARQSSRKKKMTTMTMTIASSSVRTTSCTESPTTVVVSKAIDILDARGKGLLQFHQLGLGQPVHVQSVGV